MLNFSYSIKNEAQSQLQYPRKAAPPLLGVKELVTGPSKAIYRLASYL
jgi:hypothetical protein